MLKVGVIGIGGISTAHISAWKRIPEASIAALCDIRPEQMERYPEARHYTSFEEMLKNERLDILDICLPTYLHPSYSIRAMEQGINVICEKPVSLDPSDAERVYAAAREHNVKYMIAQVLRFFPEYDLLKNIYDTGRYGKLLSGTMTRLGGIPKWSWDGWMTDEKRSGLVPFDLHVHDLDFMVYAFGPPKNTVSFRSKRPDQDYISAIYEFDGFFITAEASWYAAPYPFTAKFRFQFEDAVISNENGFKIYERNGNILDLTGEESGDTGEINLPKSDGYFNEIRYFTDCVLNDVFPDKVKPQELKTVAETLNTL